MTDVLVLTGPCGVGKSAVAFECMELLERAGVAATMVDAELAYFHPKPPGDAHGYDVAEKGLRALWLVYKAAGLRNCQIINERIKAFSVSGGSCSSNLHGSDGAQG